MVETSIDHCTAAPRPPPKSAGTVCSSSFSSKLVSSKVKSEQDDEDLHAVEAQHQRQLFPPSPRDRRGPDAVQHRRQDVVVFTVRANAGGAVTVLSDASDEYDEMLLKGRVLQQVTSLWASTMKMKCEDDPPSFPCGTTNGRTTSNHHQGHGRLKLKYVDCRHQREVRGREEGEGMHSHFSSGTRTKREDEVDEVQTTKQELCPRPVVSSPCCGIFTTLLFLYFPQNASSFVPFLRDHWARLCEGARGTLPDPLRTPEALLDAIKKTALSQIEEDRRRKIAPQRAVVGDDNDDMTKTKRKPDEEQSVALLPQVRAFRVKVSVLGSSFLQSDSVAGAENKDAGTRVVLRSDASAGVVDVETDGSSARNIAMRGHQHAVTSNGMKIEAFPVPQSGLPSAWDVTAIFQLMCFAASQNKSSDFSCADNIDALLLEMWYRCTEPSTSGNGRVSQRRRENCFEPENKRSPQEPRTGFMRVALDVSPTRTDRYEMYSKALEGRPLYDRSLQRVRDEILNQLPRRRHEKECRTGGNDNNDDANGLRGSGNDSSSSSKAEGAKTSGSQPEGAMEDVDDQATNATLSASQEIESALLYNLRGEVTELTIANVAFEIRPGLWITPPLRSGLLPGVVRSHLLRLQLIREQVLTVGDLCRSAGWDGNAERTAGGNRNCDTARPRQLRCVAFNAFRGIFPVRLDVQVHMNKRQALA
ncbi:unnamed protein product [Amoebophrya sp. A120]|nr:unnamed protein product [Amoebophrya sp. A120]|eukprot:GSA120T00003544001.1